jgi:alpha-tubulin suppressor-like RCC1 family protein
VLGRSDGTLWAQGRFRINYADGSPLIARAFSAVTFVPSSPQACAVTPAGAVYCVGDNGLGQLGVGTGDGSVGSTQTPQRVLTAAGGPVLGGAVTVAVSNNGACAIDGATQVWCWGDGSFGQLGTGTTTGSPFAGRVLTGAGGPPFTGAVAVADGVDHACAVKSDGSVWCWGQEVGQSSPVTDVYPVQIAGLGEPATSVGTADNQVCVSTTGGHVWCWGASILGNNQSPNRSPTPVEVLTGANTPLAGMIDVVVWAADRGACGIATDGSAWCWASTYAGNATNNLFGSMSRSPITALGRVCFVDQAGDFWYGSGFQGQQTCP